MTPADALIIAAVGTAAGAINTIVGSGSLITFPTLLALGYAPVLANVTNTVGLISGSVSGAVGYRKELVGQWRRTASLLPATMTGATIGAILLLVLPASAFRRIVPVLILLAVVLVLIQPRIARRRLRSGRRRETVGPLLQSGTFATAIYGGYFGAAQGVILLALLGITIDDDLQRLNGVKNILAATVNGVAAIVFISSTHIAWSVAGIMIVGSTIGGQIGAAIGRRLPAPILRAAIAVVGTAVAIHLLIS